MKKITISNALTIGRLICGPIIMVSIFLSEYHFALGVFLIAALTDVFDGYIARKLKEKTRFGQILDPIADKLLLGFILYGFFIKHRLYGWIIIFSVVVILYVMGDIFFVKKKMKVKSFGRIAFFFHTITVVAFLLNLAFKWILLWIAIILAAAVSIYYAIQYYRR